MTVRGLFLRLPLFFLGRETLQILPKQHRGFRFLRFGWSKFFADEAITSVREFAPSLHFGRDCLPLNLCLSASEKCFPVSRRVSAFGDDARVDPRGFQSALFVARGDRIRGVGTQCVSHLKALAFTSRRRITGRTRDTSNPVVHGTPRKDRQDAQGT